MVNIKHLSLKVARKHRKPLFELNMNGQVRDSYEYFMIKIEPGRIFWEIEKTSLFSREIFCLSHELLTIEVLTSEGNKIWYLESQTPIVRRQAALTTCRLFFSCRFSLQRVSFVIPYPPPFCIQIAFSLYKVYFFCFVKNTCWPDRHDTLLVSRTQSRQLMQVALINFLSIGVRK